VPADTIERAVALAGGAPLVLDPVSVPKSSRAHSILGTLHAIKANLWEAEALAGAEGSMPPRGPACRGHRVGARDARPDGVRCASADGVFDLAAPRVRVVNATGAGDAFTAGIAHSLAVGLDFLEAARFARALSAITLESEHAVNPDLSLEVVHARMEMMAE